MMDAKKKLEEKEKFAKQLDFDNVDDMQIDLS